MMNSTTGVEEREHWRNKILRAIDELRDHERTVGASMLRQVPAPNEDGGTTSE